MRYVLYFGTVKHVFLPLVNDFMLKDKTRIKT